jgi:hypothetical protein
VPAGLSVRGSRSSSQGKIAAASTSLTTSIRVCCSWSWILSQTDQPSRLSKMAVNSSRPTSAMRCSTWAAIIGAGSMGYSR